MLRRQKSLYKGLCISLETNGKSNKKQPHLSGASVQYQCSPFLLSSWRLNLSVNKEVIKVLSFYSQILSTQVFFSSPGSLYHISLPAWTLCVKLSLTTRAEIISATGRQFKRLKSTNKKHLGLSILQSVTIYHRGLFNTAS